jgi:hypothetical protein
MAEPADLEQTKGALEYNPFLMTTTLSEKPSPYPPVREG